MYEAVRSNHAGERFKHDRVPIKHKVEPFMVVLIPNADFGIHSKNLKIPKSEIQKGFYRSVQMFCTCSPPLPCTVNITGLFCPAAEKFSCTSLAPFCRGMRVYNIV